MKAFKQLLNAVTFFTVKGGSMFLQFLDGPTHETINWESSISRLKYFNVFLEIGSGIYNFLGFIIYITKLVFVFKTKFDISGNR